MSTPVQSQRNFEDGLAYAPPWARGSAQDADKEKSSRPQASPPMAPGVGGPNIEAPPPKPSTFEGDIGIVRLRQKLPTLDPEVVPPPPAAKSPKSHLAAAARLSIPLGLGVIVLLGVTAVSLSQFHREPARPTKGDRAALASTTPSPHLTTAPEGQSKLARLVLETRRAYANQPLPLQLALYGASGGEHVMVTGLAAGTRLSAGTLMGAAGWRIAAQDVGRILAYPPKDFVGAMDTEIDLRSARDALMDSRLVRLEWIAAPPPPVRAKPQPGPMKVVATMKSAELTKNAEPAKTAELTKTGEPSKIAELTKATEPPKAASSAPVLQLTPEQIQKLMDRGAGLLKIGDVAAARLVFRRAAEAGSAEGALKLGATYDPAFLRELGVLGFTADPAQARTWYERAAKLGSPEAAGRLSQLAQAH